MPRFSCERDPAIAFVECFCAVAIFWSYQKPTRVLRMAQLFTVWHGLIHEIDLVLDASQAPNQPLSQVKQP